METKVFFRVNNIDTQQGLWYDQKGEFTGLIHDKFSFCQNTSLRMDFDSDIVGYVSVVETLEQLYAWFSKEDIFKLQEHGWFIHQYTSDDYKWYDRFSHYVMNQENSVKVENFRILKRDGELGITYGFDQV